MRIPVKGGKPGNCSDWHPGSAGCCVLPPRPAPLLQADAAASAWRRGFRGGQVAPRAGPTHSRGSAPSPLPPFPAACAAGKGAFFPVRGCPRAALPPADTPIILGFPAAAGAGLGVGVPRRAMLSPYARRGRSAPERPAAARALHPRGTRNGVARTRHGSVSTCPGRMRFGSGSLLASAMACHCSMSP